MLVRSVCLLVFIFSECLPTKITLLDVPEQVDLDDAGAPLVLDCQYELESEEGLVLSWYFNQHKVYQWIKGRPPSATDPFKEHLQLDFNITDAPSQQHRALRLLSVDPALSGEYECKVSTFLSEDTQKKYLQFYDGGEGPTLTYSLEAGNDTADSADDQLLVECEASGVYPQPDLIIYLDGELVNQTQVNEEAEDGRFNSTASAGVPADRVTDGAVIRCDVTLPRTDFNSSDVIVYAGGREEAGTTESGAEGQPAAAVDSDDLWAAGAAPRVSAGLVLVSVLLYQLSSRLIS